MAVYRRGIRRAVDVEAGFDANQGARVGFGTECQHPAGFVAFGRVRQESARSVHRDRGVRRREGAWSVPGAEDADSATRFGSRIGCDGGPERSADRILAGAVPAPGGSACGAHGGLVNRCLRESFCRSRRRFGARPARHPSRPRFRHNCAGWSTGCPRFRRKRLPCNRITMPCGSDGESARPTRKCGCRAASDRSRRSWRTGAGPSASRPQNCR